jgi:capsular polysaccharide export protein
MSRADRQFYAVTSRGLWDQRADIAAILDAEIGLWPFCRLRPVDGFVGWGRRASGHLAVRLGDRFGKPVVTLEDGFLKSYAPGRADPAHSFVIDRRGIYFDPARDNDLAHLIDAPNADSASLARAGSK